MDAPAMVHFRTDDHVHRRGDDGLRTQPTYRGDTIGVACVACPMRDLVYEIAPFCRGGLCPTASRRAARRDPKRPSMKAHGPPWKDPLNVFELRLKSAQSSPSTRTGRFFSPQTSADSHTGDAGAHVLLERGFEIDGFQAVVDRARERHRVKPRQMKSHAAVASLAAGGWLALETS